MSGLRLILALALALGLGVGAGLLLRGAPPEHQHPPQAPVAEQYHCPMHPAVVQDTPGTCPICGMKLVKIAAPPAARTPLFYRNPMDARQTSPVPMKDSMGMDYLPVYEAAASASSEVEGLAMVELDTTRQQLIGLKTALVDRGVVGGELRTVARVSVDETRVRKINLKVPGFIERLHVNFIGQRVRRGQPLFSLYSPEILAAENELLLALRTAKDPADPLLAAARKKLSLWDLPAAELERLEREQTASSVVTFVSNLSGVVTQKTIVEGSRVELGATPFEVVDLSTVWVLAEVYERELRFVSPGLPASLRLDAWPGRTWAGKVLFIDPLLDPRTRTASVRLAFANPSGELKPEMFGEATLKREPREVIRVPGDAVVSSGTQHVVFISRGAGRFEPREVTLGEVGPQFTEVRSGLEEGDAVITRANFLIDSESRLRSSLARLRSEGARK